MQPYLNNNAKQQSKETYAEICIKYANLPNFVKPSSFEETWKIESFSLGSQRDH